ncbi:ATP-binding protein [Actinophytocola sp.]|uniref:ATP-binding protein n=1 Tax=Actinophytocola sp. TaxID=1872138 RepID=UPI003D6A722F
MRTPHPGEAGTLAEFVDLLRELRRWAGQPSLRRLRQLAGTTTDSAGRLIDALPASTVSDVLRREQLPRMEFVRAYVTACLLARDRGEEEISAYLEQWHEAWSRVAGREGAATQGDRPATPRQLPAVAAGFTGRDDALAEITKWFTGGNRDRGSGTVPTVAIAGAGGVGKSALAVRAAHQLVGTFPDGQLYVDLHGATSGLPPLRAEAVLGRFLRALGVRARAVPSEVDEAAALFRSLLAGRRILLVLDNVADEAQVRPLLPGTPGCGALLTSRQTLTGLCCASHLRLDVLTPGEATAFLGRLTGADRVAAEPAAADAVISTCGRLPLALRIAGARLAARPGWSLAHLAERLADQRRRLDELEGADAGVRVGFGVSYRQLRESCDPTDQAAARLFVLLGLWDGPDISLAAAACLAAEAPSVVEHRMERLVDAGMLETAVPGRYHLHDLLRLYAREHALAEHPETARTAALERIVRYYTATAWEASRWLMSGGTSRAERLDERWSTGGEGLTSSESAVEWLEAERANLLSAAAQVATVPAIAGAALQLSHALFGFYYLRGSWPDWLALYRAAWSVAERTGDLASQAQLHNDQAGFHTAHGRFAEAEAILRDSLRTWRRLGNLAGEAAVLNNLGATIGSQRRAEGLECLRQSLRLRRRAGDRGGEVLALYNLAEAHLVRGDYAAAVDCATQAVAISEATGNRYGKMRSLCNLASAHTRLGNWADAMRCVEQSQELNRHIDNRSVRAENLDTMGLVHHGQGRYAHAMECFAESLRIYRDLNNSVHEAHVLRHVGDLRRALGQPERARAAWREALELYERLNLPNADDVRDLIAGTTAGRGAEVGEGAPTHAVVLG